MASLRKISKLEQELTKPLKVEFVWLLSDKQYFRIWGDTRCQEQLSEKLFTYQDIKNIISEYKCIADEKWTNQFSPNNMQLIKVCCKFSIKQYDLFVQNEL